MLNGLILPDHGTIQIKGKVGALIALGAGFNPIITGRENIFINGSILGLSSKEIRAKFDEIIDFAELEEFIDAPIQSYSSGMTIRLGFAIACMTDPDVLLLDEVLAVGDFKFRAKCLSRVNKLRQNGTSLILVSHIAQQIVQNTDKCMYLQKGEIKAIGPTREVYRMYENINAERSTNSENEKYGGQTEVNAKLTNVLVNINTKDRININELSAYEEIRFSINFQCVEKCNFGVTIIIHNIEGDRIAVFNNILDDFRLVSNKEGKVSFDLCVESLCIVSGQYVLVLAIQDGSEYLYRQTVKKFRINDVGQEKDIYRVGLLKPIFKWKYSKSI